MARVHVDGWKTAYRGIVPDAVLEPLTVELDLAGGFGNSLRQHRAGAAEFVVTEESGEVVGYAFVAPNRDPDPRHAGELEAIYVLSSRRGRGAGRALVRAAAAHLLDRGLGSMVVWVLEANPYRRFYERLGGLPAGRRIGTPHRFGGGPLPEVAYGWPDVRGLAGR